MIWGGLRQRIRVEFFFLTKRLMRFFSWPTCWWIWSWVFFSSRLLSWVFFPTQVAVKFFFPLLPEPPPQIINGSSLILNRKITLSFSGQHYWYNVRKDMSCDEFYPMFLMYNNGKLNAFGWAFKGDFKSNRFEHPKASVLGVSIV